ncbi:unnamed protein product, partial [Didymodactylos carnosus]
LSSSNQQQEASLTPMLKYLITDENQDVSIAVEPKSEKHDQLRTTSIGAEHEDGEIDESEDEASNSTPLPMEIGIDDKKKRKVIVDQVDEEQKQDSVSKKQKTLLDGINKQGQEQNIDITKHISGDPTLTGVEDKPWMTSELRQLIKQRKRLQAQILAGDTNVEVEKKFKKLRNTICRLARSLKAKYEKSITSPKSPSNVTNGNQSLTSLPSSLSNGQANTITTTTSLTSPTTSNTQSSSEQNLLQSFLDPAMVMMMLMYPTLYSSMQQQLLSNPNILSAYQEMIMKSTPGKVASETQVVPGTSIDQLLKQTTSTSKPQENKQLMQQILLGSGLSTNEVKTERILGSATKPINLNASDTMSAPNTELLSLLENVTSTTIDSRRGPQTPPGSPPNKTGFIPQIGNKPRIMTTPTTSSNNPSILNDSPKTATPGASDQQEFQFNAQDMLNNSKLSPNFQQQNPSPGQVQPGPRSRERGHLSRHIPLTSEQMKEVLARAKNYVTSKQNDDVPSTPPISNRRHIPSAQQNIKTQKETAAQQAVAAAIAAVQSQIPSATNAPPPHSTHPIRIQLDYQKSKTLTSVIPTINSTSSSPLPVKTSQSPVPPMEPMSYQPQQQTPSPFFQQNWAQPRTPQPNSSFSFTPPAQLRGPSRPPMHPQHQYSQQQHPPFDPQFFRYPLPSQQITPPHPPPIRHPNSYNQNQYYQPHHPQQYPSHHYPPPR